MLSGIPLQLSLGPVVRNLTTRVNDSDGIGSAVPSDLDEAEEGLRQIEEAIVRRTCVAQAVLLEQPACGKQVRRDD